MMEAEEKSESTFKPAIGRAPKEVRLALEKNGREQVINGYLFVWLNLA